MDGKVNNNHAKNNLFVCAEEKEKIPAAERRFQIITLIRIMLSILIKRYNHSSTFQFCVYGIFPVEDGYGSYSMIFLKNDTSENPRVKPKHTSSELNNAGDRPPKNTRSMLEGVLQ